MAEGAITNGEDDMSEEQDAKRVVNAVLKSAERYEPCLLCKTPTLNRGIFAPKNSQRYGAPKGKTRYIVYALCEKHKYNLKNTEAIENILLNDYEKGTK